MFLSRRSAAIVLSMLVFLTFPITVFAFDNQQFYGIGFVNTDGLNLRSAPDTMSSVLMTASKNDCVVVLEVLEEWYHVVYNLVEGYMYSRYLTVSQIENAELGYGRVIANSVNLRNGPGTDYEKLGTIDCGEKCYIIGLNQGWLKVLYDGRSCYIRSDFIELTEIPYENKASVNTPQYFRGGKSIGTISYTQQATVSNGISGSMILTEAQKYLGVPYVSGGASPNGFDCSGYVYYVFNSVGVSIGRTPEEQYKQGISITRDNLQTGDIVFFSTDGSRATHCGIYAGNGQFLHSPNSRSTVSYSDLTSGYWEEHYLGARRIIG